MIETRNIGRCGDYVSCQLSATVDYKVGVAARHLASKGYEIMIDYRSSSDPRNEERKLIADFQESGFTLLNERFGYNYKNSNKEEIRGLITRFADKHF